MLITMAVVCGVVILAAAAVQFWMVSR